jgi:hypothetical protein
MSGQGKPLPSFMQLNGEWIIENYLFLYHSEPQASFTRAAEKEDGSWAVGFNSAQLASALGVDVATVVEANRNQTLIFLGTKNVAPSHGGISATAYNFRIGERQGFLTVEIYQQEGSA